MKRIVSIIGTVLVVGSVACSAAGAVTAPSTDEVGLRDPSVAGEFGNEQQDSALSVTDRELVAEFGLRDPSLESEFGNEQRAAAPPSLAVSPEVAAERVAAEQRALFFGDPDFADWLLGVAGDSALSVTDRELLADVGLRDPSLESEFGNE